MRAPPLVQAEPNYAKHIVVHFELKIIPLQNQLEIKKNAYSEALKYRQDLLPITTREHTSLSIHVVQKITIIHAQKIRKFTV